MIVPIVESRETRRDRWQQAKQAYPALALSAHQALRALEFEEKAERTLAHVRPLTAVDAYSLCEVLTDLARALEAWTYVSARLWHFCEIGQADAEIKALHVEGCEHYKCLLRRHLQVQQQTFTFCQEHQVILRFGIVTQALDISDYAQEANTNTGVLLRELSRAELGEV